MMTMNFLIKLGACLFFVMPLSAFAQEIQDGQGNEITVNQISDWIETNKENYSGVYHFGDSEWESDLLVFISGNLVCAQQRSHDWEFDDSGKIVGTKDFFVNLEEASIANNNFASITTTGKFVLYTESDEQIQKGLIWKARSLDEDKNPFDYGYKIEENISQWFSGKYPEASYRTLTSEELSTLDKDELRIMRNEIFARYGYTFRSGGAMEAYFSQQEWYTPKEKNVDTYLTDLEKVNIKLIQSFE